MMSLITRSPSRSLPTPPLEEELEASGLLPIPPRRELCDPCKEPSPLSLEDAREPQASVSTRLSEETGNTSRGSIGDWVKNVEILPTEEVFMLNRAFAVDCSPSKVNLGMGVYRDNTGNPWPFPSVIAAEADLTEQKELHRHEYLPEEGDVCFTSLARELAFGPPSEGTGPANVVSVQTISGSGANHLGAIFLAKYLKPSCVWLSDPTWMNHNAIWAQAGVPIKTYPYLDADGQFDAEDLLSFFEARICPGDVIVFQSCGHNPTGVDPTLDAWAKLAEFCQNRRAFPFIDCAYQGFATGCPYSDRLPVVMFHGKFPDMPMAVAQSFSKNFGLYGQRVGALHLTIGREQFPTHAERLRTNLCQLARAEYSIPPRYGSSIVAHILGNEHLRLQWERDVRAVTDRIGLMRQELCQRLSLLGTPGDWKSVARQKGMFSYTGLTASEAEELRLRHHVYVLSTGRMSIAGLTSKNIEHVAQAIHSVVCRHK